MASSGSHSAAAAAGKHLRVLLPFSCDSLRIPGELAGVVGAGEALVVVPFGKGKVMRLEVGWDGGGAFLGRGCPEFAAACGVGAGWAVVLRHHGGGVLTVKAFDASCCLRELGTPPAGMRATWCLLSKCLSSMDAREAANTRRLGFNKILESSRKHHLLLSRIV